MQTGLNLEKTIGSSSFFISICIPSYNRPSGLKRLLESIDSTRHVGDIQIVICEDDAPKRAEVAEVVKRYELSSPYTVKYVENEINFGHGANWRQCSNQASGEFLIYMGDDDDFIPGALDPYIDWVKANRNLGYILRAYRSILKNGAIEYHKYYPGDKYFKPGIEAYTQFFLKSMLMSGYTIKREFANRYQESSLDDTLYFQMYLVSEICLKYPSAYCHIPISQFIGDGVSYFGTNAKENNLFTPGINYAGSLKCFHNVLRITKFIDNKYSIHSTHIIKMEMSKYSSYPTLALYRKDGVKEYVAKSQGLRDLGIDGSRYFNFYYFALLVFGPKICNTGIRVIKLIVGRRLQL